MRWTFITDKKRVQQLEETTTPLLNIFFRVMQETPGRRGQRLADRYRRQSMEIMCNHVSAGQNVPNSTLATTVDLLSSAIGCKPVYYRRYEFRHAIWAIDMRGHPFILYWNNQKGMDFQTLRNTPIEIIFDFLAALENKIVKKKTFTFCRDR